MSWWSHTNKSPTLGIISRNWLQSSPLGMLGSLKIYVFPSYWLELLSWNPIDCNGTPHLSPGRFFPKDNRKHSFEVRLREEGEREHRTWSWESRFWT